MCVHLWTGSQYCDASLRLSGFDGEGVQSSSVLVVKSHSPRRTWTMELNQLERGGVKVWNNDTTCIEVFLKYLSKLVYDLEGRDIKFFLIYY